jgi:hypothetical protein
MKNHRALLDAYLDGYITPQQEQQLMEWLSRDPEHVRIFVRETHAHGVMRDVALSSVETEAFDRKRPTRRAPRPAHRVRWGAWIAVAACLTIVTGTVLYNMHRSHQLPEVIAATARVRTTTPAVKIIRQGKTIVAVIGLEIREGDRIETAKKAQATIGFENEKTTITVGDDQSEGGTEVSITGLARGKRISLSAGRIRAMVSPQPEGMPFEVKTPESRIQVLGTVFSLSADAARTELSVSKGTVRLWRLADEKSVDVKENESAVVAPGVGLRARPSRPGECSGGAPAVGVVREGTSVLHPRGLTFSRPTSGSTPNGGSFQQDPVASFKGYQYAVFHDANRRVCVARRKLPGGPWKVATFGDYTVRSNVSYCAASLGICPADGTLHVVFDQNSSRLHRRTTKKGALSRPDEVEWTASVFGPVQSDVPSTSARLTYARLFSTPSGRLQMSYRKGGPGESDVDLAEYDPASGKWRVLGTVLSGAGAYGASADRGIFLNGIFYCAKGRLHVTWCWRETNDKKDNHDLCYAYSPDEGRTWFNTDGREVGQAGSAPIRVSSTGVVAWPIAPRTGLLNSTAQAIDPEGRVHVMTLQASTYVHYWRAADGVWHRTSLPFNGGRPKLVFDPAGNAYMVCSPGRIASASAASGWRDWAVVYREKDYLDGYLLVVGLVCSAVFFVYLF